jgi:hypothetical protein
MSDPILTAMRDAIQIDPGGRGLATDPHDNLFTACPDDFEAACRSIASAAQASIAVVTGFLIPHTAPPSGETDGPLGALFLARALAPIGVRVALFTDFHSKAALDAGLGACGLAEQTPLRTLPPRSHPRDVWMAAVWAEPGIRPTHLLAVERVGPVHGSEQSHNMRGIDITEHTTPAHFLFEDAARRDPPLVTIGIGDGGNEIGMGKVPWNTIRRNVPNGDRIACRVPTDHLIVAGVSNWGAYALAAGVRYLRKVPHDPVLFDAARERELLELMVERGPLVDGPSGKRQATVDGLTFEEYAKPLVRLGQILRGS